MNNKGIAILPVVVIVAGLLAFGATGYFFYSTVKNTNDTADTNTGLVNVNTNRTFATNGNTNSAINTNTNTNVNAVTNTNATAQVLQINQEPLSSHLIYYSLHGVNETPTSLQTIGYDGTMGATEQTPTGYERLTLDSYRLAWLKRDGKLWLWDRKLNTVNATSLPAPLQGDVVYDMVGPLVYSSDWQQVIMEYSRFDKNSEAYKSEFAGPQPSSSRYFIYTFATDETSAAPAGLSGFYTTWDRQRGYLYTYRSGEGIGNISPVTRLSTADGSTQLSPGYGNNSQPAFSPDGTKLAIPEPENSPLKIHLFDLPDVSTPVRTLTLPNVVDTGKAENIDGYVYDLAWFTNNTKLVLTFSHSGYIIDVATGATTVFFDNTKTTPAYPTLSWVPPYPSLPATGTIFTFLATHRKSVGDNKLIETRLYTYDVATNKLTDLKDLPGPQTVYPMISD